MDIPVYRIYSLHYARNETRRRPGNFIDGDPHDVPMPMNFYVWAIVGDDGVWMLDTGFDAAIGAERGRAVDRTVDAGLQAIGIAPRSVKNVILSHMHWDHAGNHTMFPNATYHIQDKEMAYCTGRCMCHSVTRLPFEVTDVQAMVGRVFAGRSQFHDGTAKLAPGLSVHLIGGHSKGLQCVRVHTGRGWVVLASDAAHYYAHLTERRVFPITYNVGDTLEGYRILHELADSPSHIIPGHDPLVQDRYPLAEAGLEGIVRLDAEPI
jgi:glyoxylase-like metal-dependent hydrolase (beta-lactamase superfamily II)